MSKVELTLTGYNESRLSEAVVDQMVERFSERFEKMAEAMLAKRLEKLIGEISKARVEKELETVLAEGWQKTDQWGKPAGEPTTIKALILDWLRATDRYSSNGPRLEVILKEMVTHTLSAKGELGPEIAAAKAKFRQMVDESVMASWLAHVKSALGVKS